MKYGDLPDPVAAPGEVVIDVGRSNHQRVSGLPEHKNYCAPDANNPYGLIYARIAFIAVIHIETCIGVISIIRH